MMLQLALISLKLKPVSSLAVLWYNSSLDPSSSTMNVKAFYVSYLVENRTLQCLISSLELVIPFLLWKRWKSTLYISKMFSLVLWTKWTSLWYTKCTCECNTSHPCLGAWDRHFCFHNWQSDFHCSQTMLGHGRVCHHPPSPNSYQPEGKKCPLIQTASRWW